MPEELLHGKTIFLFALLLIIVFANTVHARSVTMNLAFNITDKVNIIHVNDTDFNATQSASQTFTTPGKKFISAEKNNKVVSMVFAGSEFLSARFDTAYSSNHYLIQMKQDDNNNRFLLAFTNGTWQNIDDKAASVEQAKILAKIFGDIVFSAPDNFPFFLRLEKRFVDISSSIRFQGSTKLLIRNRGKAGGLHNITIDVIG